MRRGTVRLLGCALQAAVHLIMRAVRSIAWMSAVEQSRQIEEQDCKSRVPRCVMGHLLRQLMIDTCSVGDE